ncbi:hypothetical protein [Fundidesulfovibrio soli]|uniref:hypothetical protein n=1 Tax=Fundidesulfovibrio soli TaxID=2922716 RepID=UPI001FAE8C08|nr:hypothetical protein [Fundidesulfovibrio soli]
MPIPLEASPTEPAGSGEAPVPRAAKPEARDQSPVPPAAAPGATAQKMAGPPYERPLALQASRILPKKLLTGPHHRVEEAVENDGYMNTYTVRSRYGDYRVASTALLAVRVDEFAAMAAMDKVQGASEFGRGVWDGGVSLVEGVKNLVLHPVDSVENAASGVGTLFNRAGDSMSADASSKYEDSTGAKLTGFASTRREYAKEFGVDPYSTNERMQGKLDSVTKAGYAGGLTSMGLKALIPGGIGIAVSSVSGVHWLGTVDLTQPPLELRVRNRRKLAEMGVEESAIGAFMDNAEFTPTQQSLLVKALGDLGRKNGLTAYVRLAARTHNQDQALFRQRMAQMYAGYHRAVAHVDGFLPLGDLVAARNAKGALVLCYPLDHLCWTENVARMAARAAKASRERGGCPVELWVTGTVSAAVRENLEKSGWTVKEKTGKTLLGEAM